MDKDYLTRSNLTRSKKVDKMVVIRMESRQRERNQRMLKLGR